MPKQYQTTDQQFIEAVKTSTNIHQALLKLKLSEAGDSYQVFKDRCKKLQIDTSHLKSNAALRKSINDESIIYACANNKTKQSALSFLQLNNENITNIVWISRKILQLKINIDHWDSESSMEDNYISRALKESNNINPSKEIGIQAKQHRKLKNKTNIFCSCGKEIAEVSLHCKSCAPKKNKIQWLPCDQIIEIVKSIGYSEAGKKFGVSDNAIRKHLKRNGCQLP